MEKIKLLAIDLDGTTLNSHSRLTKKNKEAILRAFDNGVEVVIASGRNYQGLPKPLYSLPFKHMILKNGGLVYDVANKKEIYHDQINPDDVYDVLTFLKDINGTAQAEYNNQAYREAKYADDIPNWNNKLHKVENLNEYIKNNKIPVDKIFFAYKNIEDKEKVLAYQKNNINVTIMDVGLGTIDICSRMCSKGFGLKMLSKELNIDKTNIAAIGDSDNDIIMLSFAGLSFAMKNGDEFLKSFADVIAPSNDENGLAYAIDYIIERNKKVNIND